jgi:hypothetical protein
MARVEAVQVRLNEVVRGRLERTATSVKAEVRAASRARIVLAAASGDSNLAIARDEGASVNTVRKWRGRFAAEGEVGLRDASRSGRAEPAPACCPSGRSSRRWMWWRGTGTCCIASTSPASTRRRTWRSPPRATRSSSRRAARAGGGRGGRLLPGRDVQGHVRAPRPAARRHACERDRRAVRRRRPRDRRPPRAEAGARGEAEEDPGQDRGARRRLKIDSHVLHSLLGGRGPAPGPLSRTLAAGRAQRPSVG